ETMTADQKRVADAIQSGPRGAGLRGPFNALLRSPELCDLVQRLGAFVRFGPSIPQRLNQMAIIIAGRKWTAQYEVYAHRPTALPECDRRAPDGSRACRLVTGGVQRRGGERAIVAACRASAREGERASRTEPSRMSTLAGAAGCRSTTRRT